MIDIYREGTDWHPRSPSSRKLSIKGLEEFFKTFTRDEFEQQACPALSELRQMAKEQETSLREVKEMLRATNDAIFEFKRLSENP